MKTRTAYLREYMGSHWVFFTRVVHLFWFSMSCCFCFVFILYLEPNIGRVPGLSIFVCPPLLSYVYVHQLLMNNNLLRVLVERLINPDPIN